MVDLEDIIRFFFLVGFVCYVFVCGFMMWRIGVCVVRDGVWYEDWGR